MNANNTITSYFLIESSYSGPNKKDSRGRFIGDSRVMSITTVIGTTNSSHEERTYGWLGTTNDNSQYARGEFETLEAARATAHEMGFTCPAPEPDENYCDGLDDGVVEQWVSAEAARDQWDAGDWFLNGLGKVGTCDEFGIIAATTDEELDDIVDSAIDEARGMNAELHGCLELFTELRDELLLESYSEMEDQLEHTTLREVADRIPADILKSFGTTPEEHEELLDDDLIAELDGKILVKQATLRNGIGWYFITDTTAAKPVIPL